MSVAAAPLRPVLFGPMSDELYSSTCGMFFTFYDTITQHAPDFVM
jgi:hypothetical protein